MKNKAYAVLAAIACLLFASNAWADKPVPWQTNFQNAATGIMEEITWFEHYTLWFIVPITLFVLLLLIIVVVKFRESANPVPSKTSHQHGYRDRLDGWSGHHPALPRHSIVPASDRAADAAGKSGSDGQGDRQPVVLVL